MQGRWRVVLPGRLVRLWPLRRRSSHGREMELQAATRSEIRPFRRSIPFDVTGLESGEAVLVRLPWRAGRCAQAVGSAEAVGYPEVALAPVGSY